MSSPTVRNGRYFFSKRQADQDQAVLYMRQGLDGKDQVLVDPLPMSPDHTVTVNLFDVSQDGKMLAYVIRHGGADEVEPHLFDVDAHKEVPDNFQGTPEAVAEAAGSYTAPYLKKALRDGAPDRKDG